MKMRFSSFHGFFTVYINSVQKNKKLCPLYIALGRYMNEEVINEPS